MRAENVVDATTGGPSIGRGPNPAVDFHGRGVSEAFGHVWDEFGERVSEHFTVISLAAGLGFVRRTLLSLRSRNFQLFFFGQTISQSHKYRSDPPYPAPHRQRNSCRPAGGVPVWADSVVVGVGWRDR